MILFRRLCPIDSIRNVSGSEAKVNQDPVATEVSYHIPNTYETNELFGGSIPHLKKTDTMSLWDIVVYRDILPGTYMTDGLQDCDRDDRTFDEKTLDMSKILTTAYARDWLVSLIQKYGLKIEDITEKDVEISFDLLIECVKKRSNQNFATNGDFDDHGIANRSNNIRISTVFTQNEPSSKTTNTPSPSRKRSFKMAEPSIPTPFGYIHPELHLGSLRQQVSNPYPWIRNPGFQKLDPNDLKSYTRRTYMPFVLSVPCHDLVVYQSPTNLTETVLYRYETSLPFAQTPIPQITKYRDHLSLQTFRQHIPNDSDQRVEIQNSTNDDQKTMSQKSSRSIDTSDSVDDIDHQKTFKTPHSRMPRSTMNPDDSYNGGIHQEDIHSSKSLEIQELPNDTNIVIAKYSLKRSLKGRYTDGGNDTKQDNSKKSSNISIEKQETYGSYDGLVEVIEKMKSTIEDQVSDQSFPQHQNAIKNSHPFQNEIPQVSHPMIPLTVAVLRSELNIKHNNNDWQSKRFKKDHISECREKRPKPWQL